MSSLHIIIFYFDKLCLTCAWHISSFYKNKLLTVWLAMFISSCYIEKARSCFWMTVTNQLCHGPPSHLLLIWWHYVTLSLPDVLLTSESGGHVLEQFRHSGCLFFYFWILFPFRNGNVNIELKIFEIWPNLFIPVSHHISFSTLKGFSLDKFLSFS